MTDIDFLLQHQQTPWASWEVVIQGILAFAPSNNENRRWPMSVHDLSLETVDAPLFFHFSREAPRFCSPSKARILVRKGVRVGRQRREHVLGHFLSSCANTIQNDILLQKWCRKVAQALAPFCTCKWQEQLDLSPQTTWTWEHWASIPWVRQYVNDTTPSSDRVALAVMRVCSEYHQHLPGKSSLPHLRNKIWDAFLVTMTSLLQSNGDAIQTTDMIDFVFRETQARISSIVPFFHFPTNRCLVEDMLVLARASGALTPTDTNAPWTDLSFLWATLLFKYPFYPSPVEMTSLHFFDARDGVRQLPTAYGGDTTDSDDTVVLHPSLWTAATMISVCQ